MAGIERGTFGRVTFQEGKHFGSRILFVGDGFFYHVHQARENSNFVQLRCSQKGTGGRMCRGRAVITKDGMNYWMTQPHAHAADPMYPMELELRRRIYSRLRTGEATPFRNIIMEEGQRGGFPVEVRSRFVGGRIRTAMYNVRAENLPRIPFSLPVLGAYLSMPQYRNVTQTLDGRDSIFAGWCGMFAEGTVSVVFVSRRFMNILQRNSKIFADGTFKKRPKKPKCGQIFNISITWANTATHHKHTLTLVRVLMQRRTEIAYMELFAFLKHLMPNWNPSIIMCDHEEAQVNAWRLSFPHARIETCLWHYAVDIFRYSRSLGLYVTMQADWVFDWIVRTLCALPLLPNYLLYEGLVQVGVWARNTGFMRWPLVRDLFEYIDHEWLRRYHYLSVCGSEDRTNNVSESSNATLGWDLRQNRPSVYDTIRAFVVQEDQFIVDIHALCNGFPASRMQRLSCLANDARIRNLTENLLRGQISILHFLQSASHTLQAPYNHVFE